MKHHVHRREKIWLKYGEDHQLHALKIARNIYNYKIKCVLMQFNAHCEENHLMPSYQSAYRPNQSCEAALLKVTNDILWSLEKQQVMAMMALDLSAAFDTVDHDMLLEVLNKT